MSDNIKSLLLVGTGRMAKEYAKVLQGMNQSFIVVGRSEKSCQNFTDITGIPAKSGGVEQYLQDNPRPNAAIVAVSVDQLASVTLSLLKLGIKHILVEKPGGLINELEELCIQCKKRNANIYVAYNRRFYSSVRKAKQLIEQDGGLTSFTFSFTERSHLIEKSNQMQMVKEQWFLANSSHVVDLAFYLGGKPLTMTSFKEGHMSWHPNASRFTGAGVTKNNILFSYHADWASPGNWGIHLYTKNYRLLLEPLEELKVQKIESNEITNIHLDDELDHLYKPGLYLQVQSFLSSSPNQLKSIFQQFEDVQTIYQKIINGTIN